MNDCSRAFSVRCQEEMCSRRILVTCLKKEGVLYNKAMADLHQIFHTNNKVSQAVGYIWTKRRLDVINYEFKVVD